MYAIAGSRPKIRTSDRIETAAPLEILSVARNTMTRRWSNTAKPVANRIVFRAGPGLSVIPRTSFINRNYDLTLSTFRSQWRGSVTAPRSDVASSHFGIVIREVPSTSQPFAAPRPCSVPRVQYEAHWLANTDYAGLHHRSIDARVVLVQPDDCLQHPRVLCA